MSHKALLQDQTTVRWKLVVSHYTWRSVCPPVCHLVSVVCLRYCVVVLTAEDSQPS